MAFSFALMTAHGTASVVLSNGPQADATETICYTVHSIALWFLGGRFGGYFFGDWAGTPGLPSWCTTAFVIAAVAVVGVPSSTPFCMTGPPGIVGLPTTLQPFPPWVKPPLGGPTIRTMILV